MLKIKINDYLTKIIILKYTMLNDKKLLKYNALDKL